MFCLLIWSKVEMAYIRELTHRTKPQATRKAPSWFWFLLCFRLVLEAIKKGGGNASQDAALPCELLRVLKTSLKKESVFSQKSDRKKKPRWLGCCSVSPGVAESVAFSFVHCSKCLRAFTFFMQSDGVGKTYVPFYSSEHRETTCWM